MKKTNKSIRNRVFSELIILSISLILLLALGFGEAVRTYPKYKIEGVNSLGETIKTSIESVLGAGLPLKQYVGFDSFIKPIMKIDKSIFCIDIIDNNNNILFTSNKNVKKESSDFKLSKFQDNRQQYTTMENKNYYRIEKSLNSKFEQVGRLRISIIKETIFDKILRNFKNPWLVLRIILILYLCAALYSEIKGFVPKKKLVKIIFSILFFIMSITVIYSLLNIYYDGIQGKSKNILNSIDHRISIIDKMGLDIKEFKGIDTMFDEYIKYNPEISTISLYINNKKVVYSSNNSFSNKEIETESSNLKYSTIQDNIKITLRVSKKAVLGKLWKGIKNFIVLFIASIFMASLFLNLLFSTNKIGIKKGDNLSINEKEFLLELIKPIFFLGVFIESLNASFLPQYFKQITAHSNLSNNFTPILFTIFFISYGLILIPATKLCKKKGVKFVIVLSILLMVIGELLMAFERDYYIIIFIRLIIGMAQGMLLIAVQSYILDVGLKKKKTQSMAIIVIQYNGGRIAGTAIGALAVSYVNTTGIFYIGAIIGVLMLFYIIKFMPKKIKNKQIEKDKEHVKKLTFWKTIKIIFGDFEYLKTALVGINTKLIMTGVVGYSLPLIMEGIKFSKEDIGQVLMFYSAGILISTVYSSKLVDKLGETKNILFNGNQGSALGLIIMGTIGFGFFKVSMALLLLIFGIFILGLSHGFIATPVVINITETRVARILGKGEAISIFRLFDRIGNISGPLLLGYLLSRNNNNSIVMLYIGIFIFICGLIFITKVGNNFKKIGMIVMTVFLVCNINAFAATYKDWFSFPSDISKTWEIIPNKNNYLEFDIMPKKVSKTLSGKQIFVLIPKKSSAYPVALESVLLYFEDKNIYPKFTVVNYSNNQRLADKALKKAGDNNYDLLFTMGSLATDYVFKNLKNKKLPVVSICAKDPVLMGYIENYNVTSGTNFAFTSLNVPINVQMVYLKKLVKEISNIGIIYAKNNRSALLTQALPLKKYAEKLGINVIEVIVEDQSKAREELIHKVTDAIKKMKKNDSSLIKSVFWITGSTSVFSNLDIVNKYSENVPVIGASPSMVKSGKNSAAVAIGVGFEENAQLASIYALKILSGESKPGDLKVGVVIPPDIAINFERVKAIKMKIPFEVFEMAGYIYDNNGKMVRAKGMIK